MRRLFCATAAVVFLCTVPVNAQQQPPAGPVALAVAPSHEQLGLEGDLGIAPAAPAQPQIAPKNDRLFWVLPNYLTVENRDQSGPFSTKTKFELSAKTMSDPVTISFVGAMALIGQASEKRSILWAGSAGLREALRYILRQHRDRHSYDDLRVPQRFCIKTLVTSSSA